MIALAIEFLAGRFHATPWDRAVNEGEVEWPPSPWRLMRAIVQGWFAARNSDRASLVSVIDALAEPPSFLLPPATPGHTRHYMPQGTAKGSRIDTALVLDAFVTFGERRTTAYVTWRNANLDHAAYALLVEACNNITYLGRAESWCTVDVVESLPPDHGLTRVDLASRALHSGPVVRRLGAAAETRGLGLLTSLATSTGDIRRSRRAMPNGSTWLSYQFPADYGRARARAHSAFGESHFEARIERFLLETSSTRLPRATETVLVAELMRSAVMRRFSDLTNESAPPVFHGKTAAGAPALGHEHAFFLPRDLDFDGAIDHVDVWLPKGCTHEEHRALTSVDRLYSPRFGLPKGDFYAITYLGPAGTGEPAQRWRSVTPFILERHPKLRGIGEEKHLVDGPESQVRRSLAHHGYAQEVVAHVRSGRDAVIGYRAGRRSLAHEFRRDRTGQADRSPGFVVDLEFAEKVTGPLSLGKLAHFGMGQFAAVQ